MANTTITMRCWNVEATERIVERHADIIQDYQIVGEHGWTAKLTMTVEEPQLLGEREEFKESVQPYGDRILKGCQYWEAWTVLEDQNGYGKGIKRHRYVTGITAGGTSTSYLLGHSSTRNHPIGELYTVWGVRQEDWERGSSIRVAG